MHKGRNRILAVSLLILSICLTLFQTDIPAQAATAKTPGAATRVAAEECQFFAETNFEVCGRFLQYWRANGGLAQQGLPISHVFEEQQLPTDGGKFLKVQYFQRARFEFHPANQPPFDVLLGLLGQEQYLAKYKAKSPTLAVQMTGNCKSFAESRDTTCGRFSEYWQDNGGLAQQGLPITPNLEEENAQPPAGDGKLHRVQYFQRARFEEHSQNGRPFDVLLGLLGSEQFAAKYGGKPFPPPVEPPPAIIVAPPPTPPAPTPGPTPPPIPGPVPAVACLPAVTSGTQVQACVSNSSPTRNSSVTVYGRLVVDGVPATGASMNTTWYYKSTSPGCSGTAGSDGAASCSRNIGGATRGYTVRIAVSISYNGQSYNGSTSFTPQ